MATGAVAQPLKKMRTKKLVPPRHQDTKEGFKLGRFGDLFWRICSLKEIDEKKGSDSLGVLVPWW
jgi:hypothetical protein